MKTNTTLTGRRTATRRAKPMQRTRVLAAPGMLDRKFTVTREPDDTDAEYQARCELFEILVENAKQG